MLTIEVLFRNGMDENLIIAGAINQGCYTKHLGNRRWLIRGLSRRDADSIREIARFYDEIG